MERSGAFDEAIVFPDYFEGLPDPRQRAMVIDPLDEVLLPCLLAVLAGAERIVDIARFGEQKRDLPRRFRRFADGAPSHDQLGAILATLDAERFQQCLTARVAGLTGTPAGTIAIKPAPAQAGGKTSRRTYQKKGAKAPIHMVPAFAARQRLVRGSPAREANGGRALSKTNRLCRRRAAPWFEIQTTALDPNAPSDSVVHCAKLAVGSRLEALGTGVSPVADTRPQRRLAAILAADVAGYSRLMGDDEEGALAALNAHNKDLVEPCIAEHQGRLVKTAGDGLLAEFASVVDAVRCAVAVQEGMRSRNADTPENERIVFRIGVNLGDVIAQDDDIFGDGVNVAARLEGLADPGGICISRAVRDQVRDKLDYRLDDLGDVEVKNIARPVRAFRVLFDEQSLAAASRPAARKRWLLPAAMVSVAVLIGGGLWWNQIGQFTSNGPGTAALPLPDKPSITVLPFDNLSADAEQEYFSDGVTEDIIPIYRRFPGSS